MRVAGLPTVAIRRPFHPSHHPAQIRRSLSLNDSVHRSRCTRDYYGLAQRDRSDSAVPLCPRIHCVGTAEYLLLLRSSKTVTKETMQMAPCFGRASPDSRLGSMVELSGGYPCGLLNLVGIVNLFVGTKAIAVLKRGKTLKSNEEVEEML